MSLWGGKPLLTQVPVEDVRLFLFIRIKVLSSHPHGLIIERHQLRTSPGGCFPPGCITGLISIE